MTRLVIVVPSIMDDFTAWGPLLDRLRGEAEYADATIERIHHRARWFKPGRAADAASSVGAKIQAAWLGGEYDDVVLVGHSLGGILVRQAYLEGLGLVDPETRYPWADRVSRLVLFAAMNRGVDVSRDRGFWVPPVAWMCRTLPFMRRWLANDLLQGSEFITSLRIRWIRAFDDLGSKAPEVVQLRGDHDLLVHVEDSSDVWNFPTGRRIRVPDASHGDLIRVDVPDGDMRYRLIRAAFVDTAEHPSAFELETRQEDAQPAPAPTDVVFVLHGIRANNSTWVEDVKEMIEDASDGKVAVDVASYGFFSARRFVLPITRRKFLRWLQDAYTEQLARSPGAHFHFIGHSNGTYLFGHSVDRIPSMRFSRVVLAGSVLPTNFEWSKLIDRAQVAELENHRSNRDVPVGVLCKVLRAARMRDVGTAGVDGFDEWHPKKREVFYYAGGHGAALERTNLPRLVDFVLARDSPGPEPELAEVSRPFSVISRFAPLMAFVVALIVALLAVAAARISPWPWYADLVPLLGACLLGYVVLDLV